MPEKAKIKEKEEKTMELKVTVDNHTHKGEICKKGSLINVDVKTAEMLQKVWKQREVKA